MPVRDFIFLKKLARLMHISPAREVMLMEVSEILSSMYFLRRSMKARSSALMMSASFPCRPSSSISSCEVNLSRSFSLVARTFPIKVMIISALKGLVT